MERKDKVRVTGPIIALTTLQSQNKDDDIIGCYVYDENIYTNPLSSFYAFEGLPYVYGLDEKDFIIADSERGSIQRYAVEYCKTPVGVDEFSSKTDSLVDSFFSLPSLAN